MNYNEFAEKIKNKYPVYQDMDNYELAKKIIAKYPEYEDITFVDVTQAQPQPQQQNNTVQNYENVSVENPVLKGSAEIYAIKDRTPVEKIHHAYSLVKNLATLPFKAGAEFKKDIRQAELNVKEMFDIATDNDLAELEILENRPRRNYGIKQDTTNSFYGYKIENKGERFKNFIKESEQVLGEMTYQQLDQLGHATVGSLVGAGAGALIGAATGTLKSNPLGGTLSGIKLGLKLGGGVEGIKRTLEIETGFAYQELKVLKNNNGEYLDKDLARNASIGVGVVNTCLEILGMVAEISTIPNADKIFKNAKKNVLKKIATDEELRTKIIEASLKGQPSKNILTGVVPELTDNKAVNSAIGYAESLGMFNNLDNAISSLGVKTSDTVASKTVKNSINKLNKDVSERFANEQALKANKRYMTGVLGETTTEGLQELTNVIADELVKQIQGGYSDTIFDENGNFNQTVAKEALGRCIKAGVQSLMLPVILGGIGRVSTAKAIAMEKGMSEQNAENFVKTLEKNYNQSSVINDDLLLNIASQNSKNKKFNQAVETKRKELTEELKPEYEQKVSEIDIRLNANNLSDEEKENLEQEKYNIQEDYTKNCYLGAVLNTAQDMNLLNSMDLAAYLNQNEETLLKIATKEFKKEILTDIEKEKYQEMLDAGYTPEQAFLGSNMLHAFLNTNTNTQEEKEALLNNLNFKRENRNENEYTEENNNRKIFEEVIGYIKNNQLPSSDDAYKYSDMGLGYLRTKIEDARELNDRYNKAVKNIEDVYSEKINKAKTPKTKDKLQKEYEEKLKQADEMLENTKNTILSDIEKTLNQTHYQAANVAGAKNNEIEIKSVNNQGTFDESNPNIYYQPANNVQDLPYNLYELLKKYNYGSDVFFKNKTEEIPDNDKKQIEKFKNVVDEVLKRIKDNESLLGIDKINLGYTPKKLQEAGLKNIKLKIDANVIEKAQNQKNEGHNLDIDTIKSIPELLHNPIVVMKSISEGHEEDSVVVITEAKDNEGYNVIVPIRLNINENKNKKGYKEYLINEIMSIHGRSNLDYVFSETIRSKGILKIDKNKMQNLLKFTTQLQNVAVASPAIDIITDNQENFNPDRELYQEPRRKTIEEIHEDVRSRKNGDEYRGYYKSFKDKSLITLMENADATTVIHELGHFFLESLNTLAKENEETRIKLEFVDEWLGHVSGEEYTEEQHEKFASGFEAYCYNNKAPNRQLQTVFDMFKEWVKQIHDYWLHTYEMPNDVKQVFDRIFTDDKEYSENQQKIKDLISKVKNIRISSKLTDAQKRHRECAYEIVSRATGKKINYLKTILSSKNPSEKIGRQREKIYDLCAECDDKISADGFNPEWLEFYSNADLYNSNDSELALTAYDDIINENWVTELNAYSYLDEIDAQYQYLIKYYKNTKAENDRSVIFGAVWDWLDELETKDKEAAKIYSEKYIADLNDIDRFEKLDKFEQAKETILKAAREISVTTPDKIEQYRKTVIATFDGLKFLNLSDKAKLTANILDCPNLAFLEARIDSIIDLAKTMEEVNERRKLLRAISEEINNTKDVKQGNKKVGKYDYHTNKIFEQLRDIDKWSADKANEARLNIVSEDTENGDKLLNFFDKLITRYITIKADGMVYADMSLLKAMYDDIQQLKLAGRNAKTQAEFERRLMNQDRVEEVLDVLSQRNENENIIKKAYIAVFGNWESTLNAIFNKNIRDKYSVLAQETLADGWAFEQKKKFEEEIAKVYGLKGWNFDKEILKNLSAEITVNEFKYDKLNEEYIVRTVKKKLNKMEILLAYMWDKNEVLHERLIHQFGEDTLEEMFDELNENDKRLGNIMLQQINTFYPLANEVFIKKYGTDLPKVSHYFPSVAERVGEVDLLNDFQQRSTSPSFIKIRSGSNLIPMKFSNPIAMFYKHIDDMARFIYLTETVDNINHVFKNLTVQQEIENRYGKKAKRCFNERIMDFSYGQKQKFIDEVSSLCNKYMGNWISANMALKPTIAFKQLLSACNYAVEMPVDVWVKGYIKALSNPKATIKEMMRIKYLKARFEGGLQAEYYKEIVNGTYSTKLKKLQNLMLLNVRLGDMGAIVFGGKPYIDYLIEQGHTKEEAIEKFILQTQRTQQSSATSTLSGWQNAASINPFLRIFTAYRNTQNQYVRLCADSVINYLNGDIDAKYVAKTIFMYMWFQPFLYISATSLGALRFINTGDAEGIKEDLLNSIFDLNKTAIPFIGDVLSKVTAYFIGQNASMASLQYPLWGEITKVLLDLVKEGPEPEEVLTAICLLLKIGFAIPAKEGANVVGGFGDVLNGEIQKGLLRMFGNSEYRASYALGEEKQYLKAKRNKNKKHNVKAY